MDEIATIAAPETTTVAEPTTETTETPTVETPTTETPATETTETPTETGEEEELPGDPGDEEAIATDARTMDKQTRETIAELKKTNPVAAKLLAKQFYGRQAYEKEFPTVQEARQAKATLESLGGEEGITELQNEVTDYRKEIEQFWNGDRGLIESLYKGNPESTVKMVEAALDVFRDNNNVAALDQVILGPMVQRLQQVGLHSHLLKAAEFIKNGKGQEAYDTLGAIGEWLSKLTGDAEKSATNRTVKDPREEQLTQREQRLQQQEKENFDRSIASEVNELNNRALGKTIGSFFKEVNLDQVKASASLRKTYNSAFGKPCARTKFFNGRLTPSKQKVTNRGPHSSSTPSLPNWLQESSALTRTPCIRIWRGQRPSRTEHQHQWQHLRQNQHQRTVQRFTSATLQRSRKWTGKRLQTVYGYAGSPI